MPAGLTVGKTGIIASDFGGILAQAELDVLDANSAAITSLLNVGGAL